MSLDKAALFASRLPEQDVDVDGLGTIRIRSLSRAEVLGMRGKDIEVVEMERRLMSAAMVDPKLTEDEVGQWQAASAAGELEPITKAIMALSGLDVEAPKQAMTTFRDRP